MPFAHAESIQSLHYVDVIILYRQDRTATVKL